MLARFLPQQRSMKNVRGSHRFRANLIISYLHRRRRTCTANAPRRTRAHQRPLPKPPASSPWRWRPSKWLDSLRSVRLTYVWHAQQYLFSFMSLPFAWKSHLKVIRARPISILKRSSHGMTIESYLFFKSFFINLCHIPLGMNQQ